MTLKNELKSIYEGAFTLLSKTQKYIATHLPYHQETLKKAKEEEFSRGKKEGRHEYDKELSRIREAHREHVMSIMRRVPIPAKYQKITLRAAIAQTVIYRSQIQDLEIEVDELIEKNFALRDAALIQARKLLQKANELPVISAKASGEIKYSNKNFWAEAKLDEVETLDKLAMQIPEADRSKLRQALEINKDIRIKIGEPTNYTLGVKHLRDSEGGIIEVNFWAVNQENKNRKSIKNEVRKQLSTLEKVAQILYENIPAIQEE